MGVQACEAAFIGKLLMRSWGQSLSIDVTSYWLRSVLVNVSTRRSVHWMDKYQKASRTLNSLASI